ncbi:MAG: tail fiber domain-containing protein [Bacteroidetes bacterium]|nr:tail fiber domain-containing protein [Bacteroidota bacterium]
MKKHTILIGVSFICIFTTQNVIGQITIPSNTFGNPTDYVGWNATAGSPPLNIKTELDQPIHFYTNAGNGTFNNIKMSIMRRTINGIERTGIGIHERGTNPVTFPCSILHLGNNYFVGGVAGWRTWMDVGTFSALQNDFAFFGIIRANGDTTDINDNHNDAAVVWGDNINPAVDGADNLRFIFSGPMTQNANDWSTQYSSLEVARFDPIGRLGIGNFTDNVFGGGSGIQPLRRLEIYDEGLNPSLNSAPQLRLTFTPDANVNNGTWTDFQTTANGDLFIHPSDSNVNRFVGINIASPINTLEINSTAGVSPRPSGLRFTDLNAASNIDIQPYGKVLTVDTVGHVVLTNDVGGGNVNSNCIGSPNIVARFDNSGILMQCSDIYNNTNSVPNNRIGFFTTNPRFKFQCDSTAFFTKNQVTPSTPNYGLYHPNSAVIIDSKDDEALSILHSGSNGNKDLFRIYGDNNIQYHLRIKGTPTGSAIPNSVTFDHEDNGTGVTSWMGYNALLRVTIIKDDFNTNPDPVSPTGISLPYALSYSKMFVEAQTPTYGNNMTYGLVAGNTNSGANTGPYHAGIFAYSTGARTGITGEHPRNVAGDFRVTGVSGSSTEETDLGNNIAVRGISFGTGDYSKNIGGWFSAQNTGTKNYGVYAESSGGKNINYALYAQVLASTCTTGTCSHAAGYFNGAVYTTNSYWSTSDATLKTNIQPYATDSNPLRNIPVYTYDYLTQNNFGLTLSEGNHYGVLSQDVEQVLPNLVKTFIQPEQIDTAGNIISQQKDIKAVNYNEFIPLLIAGYQKQQQQLDSLMALLQPATPSLRTPNNTSQLTVELENTPAIFLNQNDPNPFSENTTVTWNIPPQENSTFNAMLIFYNMDGTVLKTVKINEDGNGSLLVYGSKLSSGIYSYSLVVNGKTIETKRMMRLK